MCDASNRPRASMQVNLVPRIVRYKRARPLPSSLPGNEGSTATWSLFSPLRLFDDHRINSFHVGHNRSDLRKIVNATIRSRPASFRFRSSSVRSVGLFCASRARHRRYRPIGMLAPHCKSDDALVIEISAVISPKNPVRISRRSEANRGAYDAKANHLSRFSHN